MTNVKCISVSSEFEVLGRTHKISWSEAARVGMGVLLAEKGIQQYDNNLNLNRKMLFFKKEAEETLKKLEELEAHKIEVEDKVKFSKEEEEILNAGS
jgi:hypothetical protein